LNGEVARQRCLARAALLRSNSDDLHHSLQNRAVTR
jgi:hypothetical protein